MSPPGRLLTIVCAYVSFKFKLSLDELEPNFRVLASALAVAVQPRARCSTLCTRPFCLPNFLLSSSSVFMNPSNFDDIINYDSVDLPEGYDIQEPEGIEWFRSETEVYGHFALMDDELWWRNHYDALLTHGYKLRPRFHPDWRPSWLGTSKLPYACEDSIRHIVRCIPWVNLTRF